MKHLFAGFIALLFMGSFAHAGVIQLQDLGSDGILYSVTLPELNEVEAVEYTAATLDQFDDAISILSGDTLSLDATPADTSPLAIFAHTDFMVIKGGAKSGDGRTA